MGFWADYRLLKWLSLGADMSYRYGEMNFPIDDSTTFEYIQEKWGIEVTQIAIGYNLVKPKLFKDGAEIRFFNKIGTLSLSVAYRLTLEYAYYFLGHYGIFAEFGIGGPIFSGGLSFRFYGNKKSLLIE